MSRDVPPRSRIRPVPLWARWVLAVLIFSGLGAGFVLALRSGEKSSPSDTGAVALNREGQAVVARDQAPHSARLRSGTRPRQALEQAILADIRARAQRGQVQGRATGVRCAKSPGSRSGRQAFRCTAAAGEVRYPFLGVVDVRGGSLVWCKRDPPPLANASLDVPVSARCRS